MDEDCQSWEDRCNRYFSSISDTEKDHGQEKHASTTHELGNEQTREHERTGNVGSECTVGDALKPPGNTVAGSVKPLPWKSLSEMRKLYSEHRVLRHARKMMAVLDIHGSRMSYKASTVGEMVLWLIVVLVCVAATAYCSYTLITDYVNQEPIYNIRTEGQSERTRLSVSVCNMNILKSSLIPFNSRLYILKNASADRITPSNYQPSMITPFSIKFDDLIGVNSQLSNRLLTNFGDMASVVLDELRDNIVVKEMFTTSNITLIRRLLAYGRPDLVLEMLGITRSEVERSGYGVEDMLVDCWMDDYKCKST